MSAPIRSLRCFLFGLLPAHVLAPVVVLFAVFLSVVAVPGIFVLFFVLFFVVAVHVFVHVYSLVLRLRRAALFHCGRV